MSINIYKYRKSVFSIERRNLRKRIRLSGRVSKLLQKLKLNPATVLVTRNNILVSENEVLKDSDSIKIL